jgi:hypothetical protein
MDPAFRELMSGVIDYAGFFPPASLDLTEAFANYLRYREHPDRWMLGRFICPAARVGELLPRLEGVADPVELVVILGRIDEASEVYDLLDERSPPLVVRSIETRLPDHVVTCGSPGFVASWVRGAAARILGEGLAAPVFWEARGGSDVAAVVAGLGEVREEHSGSTTYAGLKIRFGGPDPELFPAPEAAAATLAACRSAGIPFKATAGLHHPLRHRNEKAGLTMHGFLNVFAAGVLAHRHGLGAAELTEILADESPESFRFAEGRLAWRDRSATAEEVRAAREFFATSFGSCSFDEPREDLRALGLLE